MAANLGREVHPCWKLRETRVEPTTALIRSCARRVCVEVDGVSVALSGSVLGADKLAEYAAEFEPAQISSLCQESVIHRQQTTRCLCGDAPSPWRVQPRSVQAPPHTTGSSVAGVQGAGRHPVQ